MGTVIEEAAESRTAALSRRRGAWLAVGLLTVSNVMSNRVLPQWAYLPWNLMMAIILIVIARRAGYDFTGVGLAFRRWHRPVGVGLLLVACTGLVLAIGLALPATKNAFMDARVAGTGLGTMLFQVLIRIPFGTVLLEEIAFRGVLPTLFGGNPAQVWRWRPILAASALFGLWHVLPSAALTTGNSAVRELLGGSAVLVAILAVASTTLVGILLSLACHIGRGLKASMLVHWATNSLGFVAAWLIIN
ncbi:MAG: CPBP family intramembrane glutamic endopeptidase [Nakamurella sp.]